MRQHDSSRALLTTPYNVNTTCKLRHVPHHNERPRRQSRAHAVEDEGDHLHCSSMYCGMSNLALSDGSTLNWKSSPAAWDVTARSQYKSTKRASASAKGQPNDRV